MYSFLFDRKSLLLFVIGLVSLGGLLFASGWLLGLRASFPEAESGPPFAPLAAEPVLERAGAQLDDAVDPSSSSAATPSTPSEGGEPTASAAGTSASEAPTSAAAAPATTPVPSGAAAVSSPAPSSAAETPPAQTPTTTSYTPLPSDMTASPSAVADESGAAAPDAAAGGSVSDPPAKAADPEPSSTAPADSESPPTGAAADSASNVAEASQPGATDSGAARFTLQIGAFSKERHARRLVERLQRAGYEPFLLEIRRESGKPLQAVRVGGYVTRAEAAAAANAFRAAEKLEVVVRPLGVP